MIVRGIFTPSRATTPVRPAFSRLITSARPSTTMISFNFEMSGVAVSLSRP